ncbi:DUF4238 domain-containing protein [Vibrio sp. Vb2354]|uniref:DUF4238 domain-containing protein n=1 Tax=unclassified Vibrio TaxID=2614977 RepID=UPI0029652D3C|nr:MULTISPECIES: DUF4238 domain-containing protein [unclassified Vibrio]MDW1741532.1 DUF4238 domain-containing protein [Vibrio sp. Vb2321]MDW1760626.1 DUF4238 domain-containing protein [Vibrio sp. Vb2353]MDW1774924.1 DUF4238 domain-containing protein [Vibrio sp. Vb2354]MDW1808317.1 DUF4238 domain-containing protein [Vibrio sp. Vb2362]
MDKHEKPISVTTDTGKKQSNPNQLSINQHIVPQKHLMKWSKNGKVIHIFDKKNKNFKTLPPKANLFGEMRLWDQWTEAKLLKTNEDNFNNYIDQIQDLAQSEFSQECLEYYAMLVARTQIASMGRPSSTPSLLTNLNYELSKGELEQSELDMLDSDIPIIYASSDRASQHLDRQVVKFALQSLFFSWMSQLEGMSWTLLESKNGNFSLSDSFYNNAQKGIHILPINPNFVWVSANYMNKIYYELSTINYHINNIIEDGAVRYHTVMAEG